MPRVSTKENKTLYQSKREELGLSREKAAELLETIPPERIERIESGKFTAHPDEVLIMAEKYKCPELCNHYCANECEIGKQYVPEVKVTHLSQIVLEMVASINSVQKWKDRLIEITADGVIEEDEIEDFKRIQQQLKKISVTADTLMLWVQKAIAEGSFPV